MKLVDGTLTLSPLDLRFDQTIDATFFHSVFFPPRKGDLNKALKDLVTVMTDQEIEQSDLNENEIEWARKVFRQKVIVIDKHNHEALELSSRKVFFS